MEVICLPTEALYALIEEGMQRLRDKTIKEEKWIDTEEAMKLWGIKSKTTLKNLRDEGKVRFSQPQRKIVLYERDSIREYLDRMREELFK